MEDVGEVFLWLTDNFKDQKFLNLTEIGEHTDVDAKAREFNAEKGASEVTIANALVISNLADKILTGFYLRFNKPNKPTKVFRDRNLAIAWLLERKRDK